MTDHKRATRADVARAVGVSPATVSVAFAGGYATASVSDATRERIFHVAEKLGYRPNPMARSLHSNRSLLMAFCCREAVTFTAWRILAGLQDTLEDKDYSTLCYTQGDTLADEKRHLERIWDRRADGLLILPSMDHQARTNKETIDDMASKGLPIVQTPNAALPGIPAVTIDYEAASYMATDHLLQLGHTRIAYFTTETRARTLPNRNVIPHGVFHLGYEKRMHEAGLETQIIPYPSNFGGWAQRHLIPTHANELARCIIDHPDPPTAVLSMSTITAASLLNGLAELGVSVPDQLSVLTFGGSDMEDFSRPALTTVYVDLFQLGRTAGSLLLQAIDGQAIESQSFQPELTIRGSTGPAPN